jgi:HSP20 family protein
MRRQSREMDPFQAMFERVLPNDWGTWPSFRSEGLATWTPAVDVREEGDAFVFTADLPGLSKDEVEVTFEENVLTIAGERSLHDEGEQGQYRRVERRYGKFTRSFSLPGQVDAQKVQGAFENGVLTVTVPKAEAARPRKIELG